MIRLVLSWIFFLNFSINLYRTFLLANCIMLLGFACLACSIICDCTCKFFIIWKGARLKLDTSQYNVEYLCCVYLVGNKKKERIRKGQEVPFLAGRMKTNGIPSNSYFLLLPNLMEVERNES